MREFVPGPPFCLVPGPSVAVPMATPWHDSRSRHRAGTGLRLRAARTGTYLLKLVVHHDKPELMRRQVLGELIDLGLGVIEVRTRAEATLANRDDDTVLCLQVPLHLPGVVQV